MRLVYDIETDGLQATKIHCIVAYNLDTNYIYKYADAEGYHGNIQDGVNLLSGAELLVGHNIIGFDNRVVDDLYNTNLNEQRVHDTWVMSQTLRYKRSHRHGLAGWGEHLGNSKIDFDAWEKFTPEMMKYCVQDVKVNVDIYNRLLEEYSKVYNKNHKIKEGLQIEHDTAKFNAAVKTKGWNFDLVKAIETQKQMQERMKTVEDEVHPLLGTRIVFIDKEPKTPKYKKDGTYNANTCRILSEYLGHTVKPNDTHVMAPGTEFRRSREEQVTLGSMDLVKEWLLNNGWKPDEYQKKKIGFEWVTTGPKLTTTSLQKQGPIGTMIDEYYTIRNREAVIRGWIESLRDDRLHGNMWTIGTPTFRCRHEVIVNLPAITASWGKHLRELLIADDGYVIVGADSSGNQLRGLCHYVSNPDFTREVIYGDQHQRNADALSCSRPLAKNYLYAYLFGAGDAKLGQVLTGKANAKVGKSSRISFARGIKGLEELRDKLSKTWKSTNYSQGQGWFPALDGRPVFCPSEHQALNYLLQSAEGITCKAAVSYAMQKIKEEGLRAEPRLFYHDEIAYQSHPDDADRVGEILKESFKEAPKLFGVECMDGGDYVIGKDYSDVH